MKIDSYKKLGITLGLIVVLAGYTLAHKAVAQTSIDIPRIGTQIDLTQPPTALSAHHLFLKIDGIEGESTDDKHKGEIEVLSYSWGETQPGGGKVNMQDFHFAKTFDKASPKLFLACANGKHFPKATLTVRKDGSNQEYIKWILSDIMCTNYQTAGTRLNIPTDQFSVNFSKIEVEYRQPKPDGTLGDVIKAGFDVKANKEI